MEILLIIFTAMIAENIVLAQFQGICPFLGVSKKNNTALGMGLAVIFVLAISSVFTYMAYTYILVPMQLQYMRTMAFILIIASLVQILEMIIKKTSPTLYSSLGVYLPLITTNCAILGTTNRAVHLGYNLLQTFGLAIGIGVGFLLAIFIMSGIREKIERNDIPKCFKGFPITLVTAALMAFAFAGFSGLFM